MSLLHCPELPAPERHWRVAALMAWPLALGLAPTLVARGDGVWCPWQQLTGCPCPLCGGTHALAATLQGDIVGAWHANPGVLPLLLMAFVQTLYWGVQAWSGRSRLRRHVDTRLWWGGGAWLLGAWMLRLGGLA